MVIAAIKRHLLLGRKVMTNLNSILKSRDITLPSKFCLVKAMIFPVVVYGCESWTIKKAEHQRTDSFELRCWRRLLRVSSKEIKPVNSKGNQPWLFIERTDAEAEAPILTLATWCEEVTHLKRPWCWERLKAGGKGGDRGWAGWMASLTQWTWVWTSSGSWWRTGKPGVLQSMGSQRVGYDWATELNWTEGMSHLQFLGDEIGLPFSKGLVSFSLFFPCQNSVFTIPLCPWEGISLPHVQYLIFRVT